LASPTLLDYSIIIPAYNEEVLLPHTIDSIRDAMSCISGKTGEIIVVDNDSSDLTAELAKAKKCRVVNESFRQIAKARNTGAKEAIGRYLFFIDADTVVPKKILQEAISKMEKSNIGGGGALLEFDHDHGRFFSGKLLPKLWNLLSERFKLFAGSFIFCRADYFNKAGGFPESHFAGEEIIFAKRLKKVLKAKGLGVCVLKGFPVCSSARKLVWHSDWSILKKILPLIGLPWLLKSRNACRFWYERPNHSRNG
jgi:glycosyltransferase involved in cell wall biosynthesis